METFLCFNTTIKTYFLTVFFFVLSKIFPSAWLLVYFKKHYLTLNVFLNHDKGKVQVRHAPTSEITLNDSFYWKKWNNIYFKAVMKRTVQNKAMCHRRKCFTVSGLQNVSNKFTASPWKSVQNDFVISLGGKRALKFCCSAFHIEFFSFGTHGPHFLDPPPPPSLLHCQKIC